MKDILKYFNKLINGNYVTHVKLRVEEGAAGSYNRYRLHYSLKATTYSIVQIYHVDTLLYVQVPP
jgi:hypothetical protein